jgi:uncharacterized protein YicC (UPF0701 family)
MNVALTTIPDFGQQEAELQKKIATLRAKIKKEQDGIQALVSRLRESATEDMREVEAVVLGLKKSIDAFTTLVDRAQGGKQFKKADKAELLNMEEQLREQVQQMMGPFGGLFQGKERADQFDEETADTTGEEPADNTEVNAENDDTTVEDFGFDKEFFREAREYAEEQRRRDPFSPEAIDALKQTPEDPEIRRMYLTLSKQVHPDLATCDDDRASRTVVMQQLSLAYKQRDFAALLTIQESLMKECGTDGIPTIDQIEMLQSTVTRLERQFEVLKKHRARMNRSKTGKMLKSRAREGSEMVEALQYDVDNLAEILEQVSEGLEDVLQGRARPATFFARCEDLLGLSHEDELEELMAEMFQSMMEDVMESRPKGRRKRK